MKWGKCCACITKQDSTDFCNKCCRANCFCKADSMVTWVWLCQRCKFAGCFPVKLTAMGGLEAVKWLVRYITCRKTDARKEEASVNSMEEENRRKKVDWLEERLTQRDEKIDGLYIELRKEQEEKIDWIHKCHEVELIQKESEVKKCEIRGCVKRMPPSDY